MRQRPPLNTSSLKSRESLLGRSPRRENACYTIFLFVILISSFASLFFAVSFYSPAEVHFLGTSHVSLELSALCLCSALTIILLLRVGMRYHPMLIFFNATVLGLFFLTFFTKPALVTVYSEHLWTRVEHLVHGGTCNKDECGDFKILRKKFWGEDCADYLVFMKNCDGETKACFKRRANIYIGTVIYEQQIGSGLYSEIFCEQ